MRSLALAIILAATPAHADVLLGLGVTSNWPAESEVSWYGNVVASGAYWRGPIGIVIDGGVSAAGADRGEGWAGAAIHVAPFKSNYNFSGSGYIQGWLELGGAYDHWGARDEMSSVSRTVLRAGVGYDLVDRGGFGTQGFVRVIHGDEIPGDIGAWTFIAGFVVLRDL